MNDNNTGQTQGRAAGLNCPICGTFIPTSIFELLTNSALICPQCHLRLNIDKVNSREAMDVLRKVHKAQENVAKASKFGK